MKVTARDGAFSSDLPELRRVDPEVPPSDTYDEETTLLAAAKGPVAHADQTFSLRRRGGTGRAAITVGAVVALVFAFVLLVVLWEKRSDGSKASASSSDDGDGTSYFSVSNYYIDRDGPAATKYPWAYQFDLVEPYLETTLMLSDGAVADLGGGTVWWEVETAAGAYVYGSGQDFKVMFNGTGFRSVSFTATGGNGRRRGLNVLSSASGGDSAVGSVWRRVAEVARAAAAGWGRGTNQPLSGQDPSGVSGWSRAGNGRRRLQEKGSGAAAGRRLTKKGRTRLARGPTRARRSARDLAQAPRELAATGDSDWVEMWVQSLYVRREMRAMAASDRDAFFDAAAIIFTVPKAEGKLLYGTKYVDIGTFASDHNTLSGNRDCDHMHDGLGFLTNHGSQTVQFEQALQSINPRATVPYWDYTYDITAYELSGDLSSFFESEVFGSDFFGSARTFEYPSTADDDLVAAGLVDPSGRILTGRFTGVEVAASAWALEDAPVLNAYGHIRSPWNTNNDPYVNRFNRTYGFFAVGGSGPARRLLREIHDNRDRLAHGRGLLLDHAQSRREEARAKGEEAAAAREADRGAAATGSTAGELTDDSAGSALPPRRALLARKPGKGTKAAKPAKGGTTAPGEMPEPGTGSKRKAEPAAVRGQRTHNSEQERQRRGRARARRRELRAVEAAALGPEGQAAQGGGGGEGEGEGEGGAAPWSDYEDLQRARRMTDRRRRRRRAALLKGFEAEDREAEAREEARGGIKRRRLTAGEKRRRLEGASSEYGSADCQSVYEAMQYGSWYNFGKKVEYQPHGPIHTLIGGVSGGDYKAAIMSRATMYPWRIEAWALLVFGIFKDQWRAGNVACPTSCAADAPVTECKCACSFLDEWTADAATAKETLIGLDPAIWSDAAFREDVYGVDQSTLILQTICNDFAELNPVIGENLQSGSPFEIAFWPTHPFVDRLLAWKRIHTGFNVTAWGPDGVTSNASCFGHRKHDKLIWKNLFDEDDHYYTNIELYNIFAPDVSDAEDYQLPYVYDNFRWDHCEYVGYPGSLFEDDDDDDFTVADDDGDDLVDDGQYADDEGDDAEDTGDDEDDVPANADDDDDSSSTPEEDDGEAAIVDDDS